MSKLTARQKAFVREYILLRDAKQAAINAGYSPKTAKQMGSENLSKPDLMRLINKAEEKANEEAGLTLAWWKKKMKAMAEATILDFMDVTANGMTLKDLALVDADKLAAISDMDEFISDNGKGRQKVKLINKNQTMDMIGRHIGSYEIDNSQQDKPTLIIERRNGEKVHLGMTKKDDDV